MPRSKSFASAPAVISDSAAGLTTMQTFGTRLFIDVSFECGQKLRGMLYSVTFRVQMCRDKR